MRFAVLDHQALRLAGVDDRYFHFEQAVYVVGEADIHTIGMPGARRERYGDLAQGDVVADHARLPLENADPDLPLLGFHGAEPFHATDRDDAVALDHGREKTRDLRAMVELAHHLGTEGVRTHVRHHHLVEGFVLHF